MSASYWIYKYVITLKSPPFHYVVPLFNFVVDAVELSNNSRFLIFFFNYRRRNSLLKLKGQQKLAMRQQQKF